MRIVVFGATGHTGALAVGALRRRGADVVACGRRQAALERLRAAHPAGVETRAVDVTDAAQVRGVVRGTVDGVLNLAGPFLATGPVPIEAALRHGAPYVDTTGEQAFMHRSRQRYHSRAEDAGVAVVHALAYEYAFGDLVARARFPEGGDMLHVLYRARGAGASAGTKKSIVRVLAAPSLGYEDGRLTPVPPGRYARTFQTDDGARDGMWIPGGEILTVPRHTPFATVRTYSVAKPSTRAATRALRPLARLALRGPVLDAVERRVDARHHAPDNASARGEIHLVAERGGAEARVVVRMQDPYVATAEAAAEGIVRLAGRGAGDTGGGVLAPAEAFDARSFLSTMEKGLDGFSVRTP